MASHMTTADTTWVSTYTFTTGELITKTIMDTYLSGELNALKTPASFFAYIDEASDYTTTSGSFVEVDSTDLHASFTTGGGNIVVHFTGTVTMSANRGYFDILVDGTPYSGNDGVAYGNISTSEVIVSLSWFVSGLSAGLHTIALAWKTQGGATATMYAGAGTSGRDVHPQFFGWETA